MELDGSLTGVNGIGFWVLRGGSTIAGFVINRFGNSAIKMENNLSPGNTIQANYLGTNSSGTAASSPFASGAIRLFNSPNNLIGGTTPADRNVIIGGLTLTSAASSGNVIQGNYIGTNATGTAALGSAGIILVQAPNNLIGGPTAGAGNLISGTSGAVEIDTASGNTFQGNRIGTDATGTVPIPNTGNAFNLLNASSTLIGGTAAGEGNTIIANNGGIRMSSGGSGVSIRQNSIYSNGGLGIDLNSDGVTPNDPGDTDSGSNHSQNFPTLSAATSDGATTTITGQLASSPAGSFEVEYFSSPSCDASGFGEGAVFVGAQSVSTDGAGLAPLAVTLPVGLAGGHLLTATATSTPGGDTSEFSACATVVATVPPTGGPVKPQEQYGASNPAEPFCTPCMQLHGDPVNTANGNFFESATDLAVTGRGPQLAVDRAYSSLGAGADGSIGWGWSSSFSDHLVTNSMSGDATVTQATGAEVVFHLSGVLYTAAPRVQATLVKNLDATFTFVVGKRLTYVFDSGGLLLSVTDLNGYSTRVTRPSAASMIVTDASGQALTYTRSGSHVTSVSDPMGRTVSYGYSPTGDLTAVTDVRGNVSTFTYDASHRMLTMVDPAGGAVTNTYDVLGRVDTQTDALGHTTTFDYSTAGQTTITDPLGNVAVDRFTNSLLTSQTIGSGTPGAATSTFEYDPYTLGTVSETDPLGRVTTRTFDARGNMLTSTDPLGRVTSFTYDGLNDLIAVVDPTGVSTTASYDGAGNLLSSSRPLTGSATSATVTEEYSGQPGDVTAVIDPVGRRSTRTYDTAGHVTDQIDPAGGRTHLSFDAAGREITSVSPRGEVVGANPALFTTHLSYDAAGNLTGSTDPNGHATAATFDSRGNQTSVTDATGNVTHWAYDANSELTATTMPDGTVETYGWDAGGNIVSRTDAGGHVTAYTYDSLNRVTTITDPAGRVTRYGYDVASQHTSLTDPAGKVTQFAYDPAGQQTGTTYSDGVTPNVSVTLDVLGRRTAMTDGTGTSTWAWDSLSRLTGTTGGGGHTIGYSHDLSGATTGITYPNGNTVTRGYDPAGRLSTVTDWLNNTSAFSYDAASNLVTGVAPNSVNTAATFDPAGQLTNLATTNGAITLTAYAYGHDPADRLASTSTTGGATPPAPETYTYDPNGRLASTGASTFAYDPVGNLTTNDGATQSFDAARQLCWTAPGASGSTCNLPPTGATTFAYDSNGNRTAMTPPTGVGTQYSYDQANLLTKVTTGTPPAAGATIPMFPVKAWWIIPAGFLLAAAWFLTRRQPHPAMGRAVIGTIIALFGGTVVGCAPQGNTTPGSSTVATYAYNGDGLRITKTVGAATTNFVWDPSTADVPMLLSDGNTDYIYGPDGTPIEQITATTPTYLHTDQLGSVRTLTNATGSVTGTTNFAVYGTPATSGAGSALGYAGEYTDNETGFVYLRARYYDPATSQFITVDPIMDDTGDAYGYANNSPTNNTDPSGLRMSAVAGRATRGVKMRSTSIPYNGVDGLASATRPSCSGTRVIQTRRKRFHH